MKKLIASLFIILLMISGVACAQEEPQRVITVSGVGEVSAVPDQASVNFSVDTVNKNAQNVVDENNDIVSKFKSELLEMGIEEKDIRTTSYNFFKDYDYSNEKGERIFVGYRLVNSFEVKIDDIDDVAGVLNKAVENGITGMNGVHFSVSNSEQLYNEALKKAVANGSQKANSLAQAIGATVKSPARIVESGYAVPIERNIYMEKSMAAMDSAVISEGELTIKASVTMEYTY